MNSLIVEIIDKLNQHTRYLPTTGHLDLPFLCLEHSSLRYLCMSFLWLLLHITTDSAA